MNAVMRVVRRVAPAGKRGVRRKADAPRPSPDALRELIDRLEREEVASWWRSFRAGPRT